MRGAAIGHVFALDKQKNARSSLELCGRETGGQEIVDEDQELLVCNLAISEQEKHALVLDACFCVHGLKVTLQIVHAVVPASAMQTCSCQHAGCELEARASEENGLSSQ